MVTCIGTMLVIPVLVLYTCVVNADTGRTYNHLESSFSQCLDKGTTVRKMFSQLYFCWKTSLYKCVQQRHSLRSLLIKQHHMCGVLQSGMQLQSAVWTFTVYYGLAMYVDVLEFHLPSSTHCRKASVQLIFSNADTFYYCGIRTPWSISTDASHLQIQYKQWNYTYLGFHFALRYEAVDIESPLISATQMNYLGLDIPHRTQFLTVANVYCYNAVISQAFLFMTNPINVACIVFMSPSLFIIFDGPGMLAPMISVNTSSNNTICFSGFLGYIVYSMETKYSFPDKKHTFSDVSKTITWYTRQNNGNRNCGPEYAKNGLYLSLPQSQTESNNCVLTFSAGLQLLRVQSLTFKGPNIISGSVSSSICQYGGLFVQYKTSDKSTESWFSACANIQNPVLINMPHAQTITDIYIAFITFSSYSSGSVHLSYEQQDCPDHLYVFRSCNNDGFSQPHGSAVAGMQTCTDIWILHNLNNDDTTQGKCAMWQDFFTLYSRDLRGSFDVSIHNQDFPLTQFPEDAHSNQFYQFVFNIMQLNDFPLDLRDNHTTVTVGRSQSLHFSVSYLTRMGFSTNHSIMQQHAHVVRIRMIQNRMCVPDPDNLDQTKHDLVLSSSINTLRLIGHEMPQLRFPLLKTSLCTVTVRHNHCTTKRHEYKLLTVDYTLGKLDPNRRVVHEISIAQIKEGNCSVQCLLNVDLWENFMEMEVVQHLRWSKITALQWDLHVRHGFRLVIGLTCETFCTIMCPFSFSYKSIPADLLPNTIAYDGILSGGLLNGSWKDAQAYCTAHDRYLPTVTARNSYSYDIYLRRSIKYLIRLNLTLMFYVGFFKTKVIYPSICFTND